MAVLSYKKLLGRYFEKKLPTAGELRNALKKAVQTLRAEDSSYRPQSELGGPGSLLTFSDSLTTIIVPDLHARSDFLLALLAFPLPSPAAHKDSPAMSKNNSVTHKNNPATRKDGTTVFEALKAGEVRVVCVGDALHSEMRGRNRWLQALEFYNEGVVDSPPMMEEMTEGLTLVLLITWLKTAFPRCFHFLKGNHENILNEGGNGNHPFKKFAFEGEMVAGFMEKVYGMPLLNLYDSYEKELPLLVQTPYFLASHAEPSRVFSRDELVNAYVQEDVVSGLTWTPNGAAPPETVPAMLAALTKSPSSLYFGGHRPVTGAAYTLRGNGRYVQLHNPFAMNVALVYPSSEPFDFERQIVSVAPYVPVEKGER